MTATRILAFLALALIPSLASAQGVLRTQDYTVGDEQRFRACISIHAEDCNELAFQGENHQQFVVVGNKPGMNVQGDVINRSDAPNDNRAVAAWNAHAHGGSLLQSKTYGCNYVGFLSGINLACQSEILGQFGFVFNAPNGDGRVVIKNEWVGTYQKCGMGYGGGCTSGKNLVTQGWGRAPDSVEPGEGTRWVDPATGHLIYWGHGTNGQHVIKCLTCEP